MIEVGLAAPEWKLIAVCDVLGLESWQSEADLKSGGQLGEAFLILTRGTTYPWHMAAVYVERSDHARNPQLDGLIYAAAVGPALILDRRLTLHQSIGRKTPQTTSNDCADGVPQPCSN